MEKHTFETFKAQAYYFGDKPKDDDQGTWVVTSADTNPDFHGAHCVHPIMVVRGTYKQAVEKAITHDEFYCYGYGDVKLIEFADFN